MQELQELKQEKQQLQQVWRCCGCKLLFSKVIESPHEQHSVSVQVLWAEEREEKGLADRQSFVDLGCGNGLLVHILTCEGVSEGRLFC